MRSAASATSFAANGDGDDSGGDDVIARMKLCMTAVVGGWLFPPPLKVAEWQKYIS